MPELSTTAIPIIAFSKLILFLYVAGMLYAIWRKAGPYAYAVLTGLAVVLFYCFLAWPLKTMWWGNTGDENLILAFLTQVLHGNLFRDYYHAWLPPFYPPLYFWLTGSIARFFTMNAVQAAKIGVTLVLAVWFVAPNILKRIYEKTVSEKGPDDPIGLSWFWFLAPFLFLFMADFDTIITKPYEVLPALLVVLLTGLCARSLDAERWTVSRYLFFGIAGGILFMTFYFWFFFACAALLLIAFFSKQRKRSLFRVTLIGCVMFVVASPYLVPLLFSYLRYGIENWQGHYLVPDDFTFVMPVSFSVRGMIALAGLVTLIFESRRSAFVRSVLFVFVLCYVYQQIGALQFLFGMAPLMPLKPFPFLSNACLAIGASYGAIVLVQKYSHRFSLTAQKSIATVVFLLLVSALPFVGFINTPKVIAQLQNDLDHTVDTLLAQAIVTSVPDYAKRTWLVSDVPAVSAVLPLSYFVSFNQHYSHHAAQFTRHFDLVKRLGMAQTPEQFNAIINEGSPRKIDALALYSSSTSTDYLLFFWVDNYPNGGKEQVLSIPRHLIESPAWGIKYTSSAWMIFVRN